MGNKIFKKIKESKLWKNKKFRKSALITGAAVFAVAVFVLIYNLSYSNKIFPKTYVGNINFGGKTKEQAEVILSAQEKGTKENQIKIIADGKTWETSAQDLNVIYDIPSSVDLAWNVGRKGAFGKIIVEQLKSIFSSNKNLAEFSLDDQKLSELVTKITSDINISAQDATIVIIEMSPKIIEEKQGKNIAFIDAINAIDKTLGSFKSEVKLDVSTVYPKVTYENAQDALKQTQDILTRKLVLKSEKGTYNLEAKDFVDWITFTGVLGKKDVTDSSTGNLKLTEKKTADIWILAVEVNPAKITDYLGSISSQIDQEPKDAKFAIKNGKAVTFQLSQTGYQLDKEKAVSFISKAILSGELMTMDLPIKITKPEITDDSAESMGIKELVGEGRTSWKGSPKNRISNLLLGAEKLSGIIVKPGEEFSTIKNLAPITAAAGFLPELVIKNKTQVTPEIGGGLCQVSTTLFRAIMDAGLKVSARTAHSFRVSYYEPPVGMDATIYDPSPDLKFVNTMKTPVLVWAFGGDNSLTFQIYGTKDGRKIEISDPWVGDYTSAGDPIYTESATMGPGEIRQVERATRGASASFTYKVTSVSGEVMENETYVSKYVPIPDSYLYGPGTEVPQPPPPAE